MRNRPLIDCMPESASLGGGLDLIPLNFPPWVWAWIWSPSISTLDVGLDLIPLNFPFRCGPGGGLLPGAVSFLGGLLGGASFLGGLLGGGLLLGGLLLLGVSLGVVSHHAEADPPWTESHTAVKTLPWPRPVTMFGRFFTLTVVTAVVPGISTGSILLIIIVHGRRTIKWNMGICRTLNRSINSLFFRFCGNTNLRKIKTNPWLVKHLLWLNTS